MNYEHWKLLQDRALREIDEYAAAGIRVPYLSSNPDFTSAANFPHLFQFST